MQVFKWLFSQQYYTPHPFGNLKQDQIYCLWLVSLLSQEWGFLAENREICSVVSLWTLHQPFQWHKCTPFITKETKHKSVERSLPSSQHDTVATQSRSLGSQTLFCHLQVCDSGTASPLWPQWCLQNEIHGGFMIWTYATYLELQKLFWIRNM